MASTKGRINAVYFDKLLNSSLGKLELVNVRLNGGVNDQSLPNRGCHFGGVDKVVHH